MPMFQNLPDKAIQEWTLDLGKHNKYKEVQCQHNGTSTIRKF
ncbi:hypothetical protein VDIAB_100210 [Vibrio diabolicus]|nr:hypothetical protein VDIAB_100210 [Vibrio diabolicus]